MQTIRLLICDLDGTLVDTLEDIAQSLNFTLGSLGMPQLPLERVRQFVGDGATMLLTRALGGRTDLLEDAMDIYGGHHAQEPGGPVAPLPRCAGNTRAFSAAPDGRGDQQDPGVL